MTKVERESPDGSHVCHHFHFCGSEKEKKELEKYLIHFREKYQLKAIIGIIGGSADDSPAGTQKFFTSDFLGYFSKRNFRIGVLSGGTKGGLPEIAVQEARKFNLPTIGVFPQEGIKYALLDQLDLAIQTAPPAIGDADWGSETPTLIRIPDAFVVIGGEAGTLVEVTSIMKRNVSLIKHSQFPVYLVPINGSGGTADIVSQLPGWKANSKAVPGYAVENGEEAGSFILNALVLKNAST
jgi:predicted Rossmann-fold nucleotide-binding protein